MAGFSVASAGERAGALAVWRDANVARGRPPSPARVARVEEKLAEDSACLLVGCERGAVISMALAEPARERYGSGPLRPRAGHVSMVFVAPDRWGQGVGGKLMAALHREMRARDWSTSSLWTRSDNARAQRLYRSCGYRLTTDVLPRDGVVQIVRYELTLDFCPAVTSVTAPPAADREPPVTDRNENAGQGQAPSGR